MSELRVTDCLTLWERYSVPRVSATGPTEGAKCQNAFSTSPSNAEIDEHPVGIRQAPLRPAVTPHSMEGRAASASCPPCASARQLVGWLRYEQAGAGGLVKQTGVRFRAVAALALAGLLQQGCATIFHGKSQTINVTSDPPGGLVTVGGNTFLTPAQITLRRDSDYTLIATKQGYQDGTGSLERSVDWYTFLGNIIFGGLIGWAIDFSSGSAYELSPETVTIRMMAVQNPSGAIYSDPSRPVAPAVHAPAAQPDPPP